jgi:leucyl aminopeptidase
MLGLSADRRGRRAIPLTPVARGAWPDFAKTLGARQQRWAQSSGFEGQAGAFCLLPDAQGGTAR